MNTKVTAVLMAAIMVATCAAVIVSADQTDAKDGDTSDVGPVNFNEENVGTLTLYMNEKEFDGYITEVVWKYGLNGGPQSVMTLGTDSQISGKSVSVRCETVKDIDTGKVVVGKYKFTFMKSGGSTDFILLLKCDLTVSVNGQSKNMGLSYNVPVNANENDDGKTDLITNGELHLNDMTAFEMVQFDGTVYGAAGSDLISKYQGYNWYAVGLPDGLSMNMNGTVTGVPTEATSSNGVTVYVTAVNKTNPAERYAGNFKFVVNTGLIDKGDGTGSNEIGYTYSVKVGNDAPVSTPLTVLVIQSDEVTMTVNAELLNGNSGGTTNYFENLTVEVVSKKTSADGDSYEYQKLGADTVEGQDPKVHTYTIPTDGTGSYKVVLTAGPAAGNKTTASYDLIVISDIENVESGIIIQGA